MLTNVQKLCRNNLIITFDLFYESFEQCKVKIINSNNCSLNFNFLSNMKRCLSFYYSITVRMKTFSNSKVKSFFNELCVIFNNLIRE